MRHPYYTLGSSQKERAVLETVLSNKDQVKGECINPRKAQIKSLADWEDLNNSHDWEFVRSEKMNLGAKTSLICRRCGARRVAMIFDDKGESPEQQQKT